MPTRPVLARSSARSLAEWLRAWDDEELAALVRARPDIAVPVPTDLGVLALRVSERTHVARALDDLDAFHLAVVDALLLLDPPITEAAVSALVGHDASAALQRLQALALVWGETSMRPVSGLSAVVDRPGGLGRPARVLLRHTHRDLLAAMLAHHGLPGTADPDEASARLVQALPAAARALDPESRTLLDRVDAGGGQGSVSRATAPVDPLDTSPLRRLIAAGLLVPVDMDTVEVPREVGLTLRGSNWLPDVSPDPPDLVAAAPGRADADAAGALEATEFVRRTGLLLAEWSLRPPAELKAGGLGQRDLRAAARLLGSTENDVPLIAETARAAGLIGHTTVIDPHFAPTSDYDGWTRLDVPQRWARLAQAWLSSPVSAAQIGRREDKAPGLTPLAAQAFSPFARDMRQRVLEVLADAEPGLAPTVDSLVARVRWHAPRRWRERSEQVLLDVLAEATALGVLAAGALASYARRLGSAGPDQIAAALTATLPDPVDHLLMQADLTAVAPGPLATELAEDMLLVADVESPGSATVYRFTAGSIRRALDAGWDAAAIRSLLERIAKPAVPQTLSYLVDDTARRHGQLRAGSATSYLRCDDEALLTELAADRRCQPMRLRRIAPTVLVAPVQVHVLLDGLREAGYAPVAEKPDGTVVLGRAEGVRATRGIPLAGSDPHRPDPAGVARIVASLRAGERVAGSAGPAADRGATAMLSLLDRAVAEQRPVLLGYVNAQGQASRRIVDPERVAAGLLLAYDHKTQERRSFALHRIGEAQLLDEGGA